MEPSVTGELTRGASHSETWLGQDSAPIIPTQEGSPQDLQVSSILGAKLYTRSKHHLCHFELDEHVRGSRSFSG